MASARKSLISDTSSYLKSFAVFKECTTGVQCTDEFLENELPDILERIVDGKSHLNIIGVGAGSGEVDLKILSVLHQRCPQVTVDNEVVEPSYQQLCDYRDLVSTTPGLEYIKFNWNEMTAEEFEEHWKEKKMTKKADIIHMFHMLYFVKDVEATISFYQSLLDKNGKLLISMVTSDSGAGRLGKTFQFCKGDFNYVYTDEIKRYLDSKGMNYQSYELPSQTNITPCFSEEDEKGELLLDFITGVLHFRKTVSPELKDEVIEFIRHPDCSVETKGKVMYKHNYGIMVIDQGYIPGSRLNKLYV